MAVKAKYLTASIDTHSSESLRIAYLDHAATVPQKGTILLIHGFPQTSYQFRHVLPLLAAQGYRSIAPDYRGAGNSTKPKADFRKTTMAADMIALLNHLDIKVPVYVIGHDIGGMIAFAMATRYPHRVQKVIWGECPLPGTTVYRRERTEHAVQQFHFIFHSVSDLPESLIAGKERLYITHFLTKITFNVDAFADSDIDVYTRAYEQPGAIRSALEVYRAFEEDAKENLDWIQEHGKCQIPTLVLSGSQSRHRDDAEEMAREVTEVLNLTVDAVDQAGHYVAEENPRKFVKVVLDFIEN